MTINDIHDLILFYTKKDRSGYLNRTEIDNVLHRAQLALFEEYHGTPKLRDQGGRVIPSAYGSSQRIDQALSKFRSIYTFTADTNPTTGTPGGVITLPADLMYLNALKVTRYVSQLGRNVSNSVEVLNEEELISRLESQVLAVTPSEPICIMNSQNKIQLFPEVPASGQVFYFRMPAKPKFAYTISGRTITYDHNASTQLEWNELDINNIIIKALSYFGLNLSANDIVQFAELKGQQGQ